MDFNDLKFEIDEKMVSNGRVCEGYTDKKGHHYLVIMDLMFDHPIIGTELAFDEDDLNNMLNALKKAKELY